jgi:ABC-type tungstate transport system substrate-binding protein
MSFPDLIKKQILVFQIEIAYMRRTLQNVNNKVSNSATVIYAKKKQHSFLESSESQWNNDFE